MKKKRISITINADVLAELKMIAHIKNQALSALIEEISREKIKDLLLRKGA